MNIRVTKEFYVYQYLEMTVGNINHISTLEERKKTRRTPLLLFATLSCENKARKKIRTPEPQAINLLDRHAHHYVVIRASVVMIEVNAL